MPKDLKKKGKLPETTNLAVRSTLFIELDTVTLTVCGPALLNVCNKIGRIESAAVLWSTFSLVVHWYLILLGWEQFNVSSIDQPCDTRCVIQEIGMVNIVIYYKKRILFNILKCRNL